MTKQGYLILGIVIILLIAGALFAWQKREGTVTPPVIEPAPVTSVTPTPPTVAPPTTPTVPTPQTPQTPAGWKTYENKEFGFEIKYPLNWKIEDRERDDTRAGFDIFDIKFREKQIEEFNNGDTDAPLTGLSLGIFNLTNDIQDFIKIHYNEPPISIIRKEDIKFSNGVHALRIVFNVDPYGEKQVILFYSENYAVEFLKWITGPGSLYESMEQTFDQIILTFRFLK